RRTLGDSADQPRYIETLARRGYRLMVPIEHLNPVPEIASEKDRERPERSAAEISGSVARVQRQTVPHWWKAAFALVSAVILLLFDFVLCALPFLAAFSWNRTAKIGQNQARRAAV